MITIQFPHNVVLMDDDVYALLWEFYLLSRDIRTRVLATYKTPVDLLSALHGPINPDVILLDAEYLPHEPPLSTLIDKIRLLKPAARIICLSQYSAAESIRAVFQAGASGFLIKDEIGLALATSVSQACLGDFVTTPGAIEVVSRELPRGFLNIHCLPRWVPNPNLTPQISASFWLRVLFGLRAPLAADELGVAPGTVEKYVSLAYQRLLSDFADDNYLTGIDLDSFPSEEKAFMIYTMPPRARRK